MAANPMLANLARTRIIPNSVEGYQLLKLDGQCGGLDSLRKQLSVRFKNKLARGEPEEDEEPLVESAASA
ncbi:hypothetical protein MUU77_07385 [Pseudoxanthomonas sp. F37]|uniref:hypothetical protein n=1 Tax=Pseudoxanthomonas TaxID=83618 RepID=UPI001FD3D214|nr:MULTISPECIES: hypothetical protein [Pseudoxanthomonas]UOV05090.1 hypothetical protein MUU75_18825 [Pseudoxanthomonas mexicana]UOV10096.1 hypothetical protein MUU77_07385 [Pseudoxanthomonas sp. F37]